MPSFSELPPQVTPGPDGVSQPDDGLYDADPVDPTGGGWRLSRLNVGLLSLSILSLSAALYISPAGSEVREKVQETLPNTISEAMSDSSRSASAIPSSATPSSAVVTPGAGEPAAPAADRASSDPQGSGSRAQGNIGRTPGMRSGTMPGTGDAASSSGVSALSPSIYGEDRQGVSGSAAPTAPEPGDPAWSGSKPGASPGGTTGQRRTQCYQFTSQQDAQRYYLSNLSDPYGLDADPGPQDGDGLACTELPVDPDQPASTPVAAYSPPKPSVATKKALLAPNRDYFGFLQDGVPGDTAMVDRLAARAGKAPSTTGWFTTFDEPYRADLVRRSWSRGALPVITWMPTERGSGTSYSLSSIIAGAHDRYLRRFAAEVVREGLPVSLRFAHEMNGSWYPWSAGRTDYNNSPAKYVAAWRHVWQVFDDAGATDNVIWLWSPGRVDNLKPSATNGLTTFAEDYPGNAYVDWVGATVYLRKASVGPTYAASFAKTVADLEGVTDKPIFFGETGAVQTDQGVDRTALKATWITNVLGQFAADDRVVGFLWFNNVAATEVNGVQVHNDWRFDASRATQDAFRKAVASPHFAEGMASD